MNKDFWKSRWKKQQTGWHLQKIHPKLVQFWPHLSLDNASTVLVPLCGKSLDLQWLTRHHQQVIGVEWVEEPVRELMEEHSPHYEVQPFEAFNVYRDKALEIWNGDFFRLPPEPLPPIDAIYDRGSLVSLPAAERSTYARKVNELSYRHTQMLLICYEYPQDEMEGPPYSISHSELETLYGQTFMINHLLKESILERADGLRNRGLSSYLYLNVYHLAKSQDA